MILGYLVKGRGRALDLVRSGLNTATFDDYVTESKFPDGSEVMLFG